MEKGAFAEFEGRSGIYDVNFYTSCKNYTKTGGFETFTNLHAG